jgi:hypothetical protein
MTHTYTISNTPANTGTVTLNAGAGYNNTVTIANLGAGGLGGGNGGAGQIYTTNGTGASNWATSSQTQFNGGNGKPVMSMPQGKDEVILEKDATLTVKGKVVINGFDLEERLKTIEKVLMIPERDVTMESKYPSLKKKFDEYITALGKYRTFEAIKGEDE